MMQNDLISRKALMDAVDKSQHNNPHSDPTHRAVHKHEHNHFLVMILQAHTVDAAPVVHGQFVEWYPPMHMIMTGEEMLFRCSSCDAKYSDVEGFRFCPHCGAMMDGKDDT